MNVAQLKRFLLVVVALCLTTSTTLAQSQNEKKTAHASAQAATTLGSLPDADTVIYLSPRRIMNDAAPKVMSATDLEKTKAMFFDLKRSIGIDPSSVESLALAIRFQKPEADLSFVAPDLLAVLSGDFSADSMVTLVESFLGEQARTETYSSKKLTIVKLDPVVEAAKKTPMLKSFTELGVVALNTNTLAIGNISYLKAAVDAGEGNGRINPATLSSLLRDPNALVSAAGAPITAFAKSFGLMGTQASPRESSCNTRFGDFYAAVTMDATNFNLRGAMNTDNPDTAKIIHGLVSSLLTPAMESVPDKEAASILKTIKLTPRENEIVVEADVSQETVAKFIREQTQPKATATPGATSKKPAAKPRRKVRRK